MTATPKTPEDIALELAHAREVCGYDHDYADDLSHTCCGQAIAKQAKLISAALRAERERAVADCVAACEDEKQKWLVILGRMLGNRERAGVGEVEQAAAAAFQCAKACRALASRGGEGDL